MRHSYTRIKIKIENKSLFTGTQGFPKNESKGEKKQVIRI